ncbi:MAG: CDP-diacylglycerol--glycerol-3-phosphate 3-phosphatidyltransferase [Bacilli bacterium]|nr:CDP-diacylglycerol--glycerol-3-phosphate 3-phosphatidyltransferase [Bacilli bacterium]
MKKKIMNLPNKITLARIFVTALIVFILLFPFGMTKIDIPKLFIDEKIIVDLRYPIAGVLFIIASLTDFLDGYLARSRNLVTDFGKMLDAIADKVLVNAVLVILASQGQISPIIAVIIIVRDIIVDSIKMVASSKGRVVAAIKSGKFKTACMMVGLSLTLFYNLPFELIGLRVDQLLLLIATVLSVISGIQYYILNRELILKD